MTSEIRPDPASARTAPRDLFEALAQSAPDAILTIDEHSTVLFANSAVERIFGYTPEELVGKSLKVLIPERMHAQHDAGIARYLRSGRRNIPWTGVDLPGVTRDGREIPLEVSFGELRSGSGEVIFSGFVRDISERIRQQEAIAAARAEAERALRELTRLGNVIDVALAQATYEELLTELLSRLRQELQADEATVMLVDEASRELTVRMIDAPGFDVSAIPQVPIGKGIVGEVARTAAPVVVPDVEDSNVYRPALLPGINSLAVVPVSSDGTVIGVLRVGSRQKANFSEADVRLLAIVADRLAGVFARTRMYEAERRARRQAEVATRALAEREAELSRLNRELEERAEEERSLRTLAQSITGAVRISEVMHQIAEGALAVSGATGAYVEQVVSPDGEVEVVACAGESTPAVGQRVPYPGSLTEEIIAKREPVFLTRMEGFGAEMAPYLNEQCPGCSVLVVPLLTDTAALGALVLLRKPDQPKFEFGVVNRVRTLGDLTSLSLQRLTALAESERRRSEAEAAVRTREEVLSVVSHDLRNPVSTVQMSASLLQDNSIRLSEEDRQRQITVIARSAQRMNRLIQDLLDVARIEGGRFSISCRCEDPGTIASEAVEAFRPIASEKDIHLDCAIASPLRRVNADRDRLLQVLSNYLNNAVKFTPRAGSISLRAAGNDAAVVFSVSDTGPGIPPEDLKHAFSRFWQARETAHLGSGLGLAIAKGIANAHDGRVWVESVPGKGSTFYLEIPYSEECA